MTPAWIIRNRGIVWECRTEQDALGVLCYMRDFGREPLGPVTITPEPTETMARLLATLPGQAQKVLL